MKMAQSEQLNNLEKLVFKEDKGKIYIGGREIEPAMLDVLKKEADYIKTSQILEILNATITNESFELGVGKSTEWNGVIYAKALYGFGKIFNKMILKLSKLDK